MKIRFRDYKIEDGKKRYQRTSIYTEIIKFIEVWFR
jgi:hypothetical protein